MKKILILAGASVHKKVVKSAKEMGLYTIVADYLELEDSPAKQIADEHWEISITDVDKIVNKCKTENVSAVLAFCIDPAQIPYQKICDRLNVPCYGTEEQFAIFTNKRRFKEYCRKHYVDVIPEYSIEDVYNNNVIYPILIKPSESRGSRGISVCSNKSEALNAIELAYKETKDNNIIIERYMNEADDMSFAYVIINKKPHLIKIGDRILGKKQDNLDRQQIATVLPSKHTRSYLKSVDSQVKAMIKSLGINFGAIFLQGFFENDKVYFYDPGFRFPGSDYDIALKKTTGYDNMTSFVNFAISGNTTKAFGNPQDAFLLNNKRSLILSISCRPGTISKIEGVEEIEKLLPTVSTDIRIKEGSTIPPTGDIRQRVLEFVAFFENTQDLKSYVNHVYETIKISDIKGEDMIVSRINTDSII